MCEKLSLRFFLSIPGIPGGSTTEGYEDMIELNSYSLGFAANQSSSRGGVGFPLPPFIGAVGGGASAGKTQLSPLNITKYFDISSIPLLRVLMGGTHLSSMTLFVVSDDQEGTLEELLRITFGDVLLTQFNQSGNRDDSSLIENLQFQYSSIIFESNAFGVQQRVGFDFRRNRFI